MWVGSGKNVHNWRMISPIPIIHYPLVIKHGLLENHSCSYIDDFPILEYPISLGISQLAMFDYLRAGDVSWQSFV